MNMFSVLLLLNFSLLTFVGCEQKVQERHYNEVAIEPSERPNVVMSEDPHAGLGLDMPAMPQSPSMKSDLAWTVPSGWQEEAASGMRVATFKLTNDPDAIDVSIVSLGGMAGGLEANLSRWATQLGLKLKADEDLPRLIEHAEQVDVNSGARARIFDFSTIQEGQSGSTKSMMAAMIEIDDATVFVKMTGTIDALRLNKDSFQELTKTVHKK